MAKCIAAAVLALLLLGSTSCVDLRARAHAAYMQPQLSGDVALASTTLPATLGADVQDDLGVDTEQSPYVRLELGTGIVNVTASAFQYGSSGSGVLDANFGNITAGVPVNSDIDVLNIRGAVTFDLIDLGPVRISPGLAVDYTDLDFEVRQTTGGTAIERLEVQIPAPLLYVQAEADLGPLIANIDAGGMKVDLDEVDGTFWDIEAMLRYAPAEHFEIFGGYRLILVDGQGTVDGQAYDADVELSGWFAGGGISF